MLPGMNRGSPQSPARSRVESAGRRGYLSPASQMTATGPPGGVGKTLPTSPDSRGTMPENHTVRTTDLGHIIAAVAGGNRGQTETQRRARHDEVERTQRLLARAQAEVVRGDDEADEEFAVRRRPVDDAISTMILDNIPLVIGVARSFAARYVRNCVDIHRHDRGRRARPPQGDRRLRGRLQHPAVDLRQPLDTPGDPARGQDAQQCASTRRPACSSWCGPTAPPGSDDGRGRVRAARPRGVRPAGLGRKDHHELPGLRAGDPRQPRRQRRCHRRQQRPRLARVDLRVPRSLRRRARRVRAGAGRRVPGALAG
ncbi:hypothetical protein Sinac_2048 [Singulisphaera acidiphila DSM 18658]|uniref:Uncharacterized protein n=1 Tax=Singulisphaera acidiphila (strain ATCC BAA-1392 / DSM 18658 / VKM B-2454 / MOB10) TaxID=886293 RepID=L0DCN2_SINAD|nr:hypothetical protein Sinac_2048 [Singulisphaera acidiphila DSM 18658]